MILFAYNNKSAAAKALAHSLGVKLMREDGPSKYKGGVVLNWGNAKRPLTTHPITRWINKPEAVNLAIDKLRTFQALAKAKVLHVPFTTSKEDAAKWLAEGQTVFARTTKGHSGHGISVVTPDDTLPDSPLYTCYVKKRKEFRVHVIFGKVVDIAEKRRVKGEPADTLIRSHLRGWVFCRQDIVEPTTLRDTAIKAVAALGLDFGAVDIIWNEKQDSCYVLEINTAPGIEGTTLEVYKNEFQACK